MSQETLGLVASRVTFSSPLTTRLSSVLGVAVSCDLLVLSSLQWNQELPSLVPRKKNELPSLGLLYFLLAVLVLYGSARCAEV
jgi:hypothetical protein